VHSERPLTNWQARVPVSAGDFNDLEPHLGDYPDIYGDDDEHSFGSKVVAAPLRLLAFLGGAGLFFLGPWTKI
jgi:hypothetical protein